MLMRVVPSGQQACGAQGPGPSPHPLHGVWVGCAVKGHQLTLAEDSSKEEAVLQ